jgi:co-chaperonin GroES (HSP10)
MDSIAIKEIIVYAKAGAEIGYCMKEGIELAAREWQNVRLIHNDNEYLIMPNELLAVVRKYEGGNND